MTDAASFVLLAASVTGVVSRQATPVQTNAAVPVIDRPTMRVFISLVPSYE